MRPKWHVFSLGRCSKEITDNSRIVFDNHCFFGICLYYYVQGPCMGRTTRLENEATVHVGMEVCT